MIENSNNDVQSHKEDADKESPVQIFIRELNTILQERKKETNTKSEQESKGDYTTDLARNLAVLFGFYFVFLSAILGFLPFVLTLSVDYRLTSYFLVWLLNLSMYLVGFELLVNLYKLGMSRVGILGLLLLVLGGLFAYQFLVGEILLEGILFFGIRSASIGFVSFTIASWLLSIVINWNRYRIKKILSSQLSILNRIENHIKKLPDVIRQTEDSDELEFFVSIIVSVPMLYQDELVKREIANTLLRLHDFEGVLEEIERCPELLENFQIRKAIREKRKMNASARKGAKPKK